MRYIIAGLITLTLGGCQKTSSPLPETGPRFVSGWPQPRGWLALGDSYTIGQGVAASERFPAQTVERLIQRNLRIDTLDYIATTGWTTPDLLQAILERHPTTYSVVSLLIGVNDQYRGRDTGEYRIRFTTALDKAVALAGGRTNHVFVLSIPDYGVTPYARFLDTLRIRLEIDQYNRINREISSLRGCKYLDITDLTREGRKNRQLICGDSLHPSGTDYGRWADRLAPMMEAALQ